MKFPFIVLIFSAMSAYGQSKGDFLKVYSETSNFISQISKSELAALKECACFELGNAGQKSPYCTSYSEPQFIREGINLYGDNVRRKISCKVALNQFVYSPISYNFPLMKRAMALMEPEQVLLNRSDATLSESFITYEFGNPTPKSGVDYKINLNPVHKIRQSFLDRSIPLKNPGIISNLEKELLLKIYGDFGVKACLPLIGRVRSADKVIDTKYQGIDNTQICNSLIYSNQGWKTARDFPIYENLKMSRRVFREKFTQVYVELISKHPILTLVSSPQPSLREIIGALDYMAESSAARAQESKENLRAGRLNQFIANYFAYEYAKLLWTAKGYEAEQFDAYYNVILSELERSERFKSYLETGALLTVAVGCAVPWGRGIGMALSLVKSVCLAGLGIPVNLYFAISSNKSYSASLRNFFSSAEAARVSPDSFRKVESADMDRLLSAILLPAGMGVADTKNAASILKQIIY